MSQQLHVLITAGPTREPLDPVRFISNRSSGKMGYAIAAAAAERGHRVSLISGPVSISPPPHPEIETVPVETARQMFQAVEERLLQADVAIMTAAVSDYRPRTVAAQKMKKGNQDHLVIELEKTEDILGSARHPMGFTGTLVGFAAETERVEEYARAKLERKQCDLIVANDVSQPGVGFDSPENEVVLYFPEGRALPLDRAPKPELASRLIEVIEALAAARGSAES